MLGARSGALGKWGVSADEWGFGGGMMTVLARVVMVTQLREYVRNHRIEH